MNKVVHKQQNSKECFVCGSENTIGFNARFYEMDNNQVVCLAKCENFYQSYPNRLHGGMSAMLLDETMGRAIMITDPRMWSVTVDLQLKYIKPVPLDNTLRIVGKITDNRRLFVGEGYIMLEDGTIAVTATARYLKQSTSAICGIKSDDEVMHDVIDDKEIAAIALEGPLQIEYK